MNKKGWTARDYVVGLILFSGIIALAYIMVGSQAVDYNNPNIVDENFEQHYNRLSNNTKLVDDMLNSTSSKEGLSIIGTSEILLSSTFSVINLIFGSLSTLASQVLHISDDFGIPSQITSIILVIFLSIITVGIIFLILNFINRTDRL